MDQNLSPSFWLDSLGPLTFRPALPGDRTFDVAIAGGGYTGLWTADYLARQDPALRIVVLEKEYRGFGASGRNGGWCSGLFPMPAAKLTRRYGAEPAAAMTDALAGTVDEVGRVAEAEGIDCRSRGTGCRRSGFGTASGGAAGTSETGSLRRTSPGVPSLI
jgi:glycine/D-amino acid oxidase-like deaminating enzyme